MNRLECSNHGGYPGLEELESPPVSDMPHQPTNRHFDVIPLPPAGPVVILDDFLAANPVAVELSHRFVAAGHQLYLVGGSVRDTLLDREGTDLDFTTDAHPEQIMQVVSGWAETTWDTGIAFGTVGVAKKGLRLEITTFRSDLYDGQSRNPEVTFGDTLEADLIRRDFAINAMAVSLPGGVLTDLFDGRAQLEAGVIDTPGTPEQSFGDDPLRMMRAARLASQLNFTPAIRVIDAMTAMHEQLRRITAERIQAELNKLLIGRNPRLGLGLLTDTGLADVMLPELPALRLERDEHHQHKDVYEHSLQVLERAISFEKNGPDLVLRLAALLHDIGKPPTRRYENGGGVSFHHHEVVGAKLVKNRMRALKYSKQMTEDVRTLTFLHLRFHGYGSGIWTDSAVRRYVTDAGPLLERLHLLVRADCTTRNRHRELALQRSYDELEERIAKIAAQEDLARVRPDLDGNAIMELLGVGPGPIVGQAWAFLKELRMESGPLTPEEATAQLYKWALAKGLIAPQT